MTSVEAYKFIQELGRKDQLLLAWRYKTSDRKVWAVGQASAHTYRRGWRPVTPGCSECKTGKKTLDKCSCGQHWDPYRLYYGFDLFTLSYFLTDCWRDLHFWVIWKVFSPIQKYSGYYRLQELKRRRKRKKEFVVPHNTWPGHPCPQCGKSEYVYQIVYGYLPLGTHETLQANGRISGGCIVSQPIGFVQNALTILLVLRK